MSKNELSKLAVLHKRHKRLYYFIRNHQPILAAELVDYYMPEYKDFKSAESAIRKSLRTLKVNGLIQNEKVRVKGVSGMPQNRWRIIELKK